MKKVMGECLKCFSVNNLMNTYRKNLSHEYNLIDLAELFKVFEDVNRIKILFALIEGEMCVCDIVNLLGMSQSAVSHQLRILKQSRLVRVRKQGKLVYYSLGDNRVRQIFNCGLCHIEEIYNI